MVNLWGFGTDLHTQFGSLSDKSLIDVVNALKDLVPNIAVNHV